MELERGTSLFLRALIIGLDKRLIGISVVSETLKSFVE